MATALPGSVQSLLTARVDRLAPTDRALLQAASVIGRRFNPRLLAAAIGESEVEVRLAAMQALDLVHLKAIQVIMSSNMHWYETHCIKAC